MAIPVPEGYFSSAQDRPWQWSPLAGGTLWSSPCCSPGRKPHFPPTLELVTDCSVWEWHEMWYLADGSGLFVLLLATSPFLFHFMFPFLHTAVPELQLWDHVCLCLALKGSVQSDQREALLQGLNLSFRCFPICLVLTAKHTEIILKGVDATAAEREITLLSLVFELFISGG